MPAEPDLDRPDADLTRTYAAAQTIPSQVHTLLAPTAHPSGRTYCAARLKSASIANRVRGNVAPR